MHSNAPGILWFHTFKFDPGLTNVQLLSSRHLLMESGFFSLPTLKPKYFAMKVQGNWCNVACLFKKNVNKNFRIEIIGSKLNLKIKPLSQYTKYTTHLPKVGTLNTRNVLTALLRGNLNCHKIIPTTNSFQVAVAIYR